MFDMLMDMFDESLKDGFDELVNLKYKFGELDE